MNSKITIKVKCVACGHKQTLTGNDIPTGEDPPICPKCYSPMTAEKVKVKP